MEKRILEKGKNLEKMIQTPKNTGNSNKKDDKYSFSEKTVTAEEYLEEIWNERERFAKEEINRLSHDKDKACYKTVIFQFKVDLKRIRQEKRFILKALSLKEQEVTARIKGIIEFSEVDNPKGYLQITEHKGEVYWRKKGDIAWHRNMIKDFLKELTSKIKEKVVFKVNQEQFVDLVEDLIEEKGDKLK
jgi:hypothetical protein